MENVDEWYGVRYRTGGNTKSGVDCSGFTVAVLFSRVWYCITCSVKGPVQDSRKISTTELQEGDLVFFNTTGAAFLMWVFTLATINLFMLLYQEE